jgi:hypothetical protein
MRYLCIVHIDPARMAALSEAEDRELTRDCMAYDQELLRSGHLIVAQALQAPDTARIVRVSGSEIAVTDGPYMETKEFLGGFLYVEAPDLEAAVEIAANCPMARMGAIEVRPQMTFSAVSPPSP